MKTEKDVRELAELMYAVREYEPDEIVEKLLKWVLEEK